MTTEVGNEPRNIARHGGVLLDAARDELGLVEVVRHGRRRSLHFDSDIEQASYLPDEPERLLFDYSRDLVLASIFPASVDRVLLLGLGAGTVAGYLLRRLGAALQLDAVEYREVVADMAYRHFDLPVDPRLQIYIASAARFVDVHDAPRDVILADLYDANGMNAEAERLSFLDTCRMRLAPAGVLAINLWRTDPAAFDFMLAQLREVFGNRMLRVDADDANAVVYCFADDSPDLRDSKYRRRLTARAGLLGFDGETFLRRLRRVGGKTENCCKEKL